MFLVAFFFREEKEEGGGSDKKAIIGQRCGLPLLVFSSL